LDHVYGHLNKHFDDTSSVETNETPSMEILKKRNADPNLINMLNFVLEENKLLKKKLKTMNDGPNYNKGNIYGLNANQQLDVDSFFRSSSELDTEPEKFLNLQPTFLY